MSEIAMVAPSYTAIRGKVVAVRRQDLRVTDDHEIDVLDVPVSTFDDARSVYRDNFEKFADIRWARG